MFKFIVWRTIGVSYAKLYLYQKLRDDLLDNGARQNN